MKIIFDSEKQKDDFIQNLSESSFCPGNIGIESKPVSCNRYGGCFDCWEKSIEMEVKEQ